jgi:predicted nuclease with TOPRIM domain
VVAREVADVVRESRVVEFSAEAVMHMTASLLQVTEKLADRDHQIVELLTRVEALEERDRLKTARIAELEQKIQRLEEERHQLRQERDALADKVAEMNVRSEA